MASETKTYTWTVEVEGIRLKCEYWPGLYNESTIKVRVPLADPEHVSGQDCDTYLDGKSQPSRWWKDYPENDDPSNPKNFHEFPGGQSHGPTTPFEVWFVDESGVVGGKPCNSPFSLSDPNLDRLCTTEKSPSGRGPFVVFKPEVARAVRESLRPVLAAEGPTPKLIALALAERVPAGTRKEDFLPFVTAVLQSLEEAQDSAFSSDNAAGSFALAGEQIQYQRDFRRLAGRDFDRATDRITWEQVEALPITPPQPRKPVVYECLECGADYPPEKAHLIDAGGMGCVRCNH